jgi:hypothetical protein
LRARGAARLIRRVPLLVGCGSKPVPAGSPRAVIGLAATASFRLARTPDAIEQPETHVPYS